jgi:transcriptional regulator with XRE-family HTH domain
MNMDPDSWSAHVAAAIRTEMASQHHALEALAELLGVAHPTAQRLLDGDTPFDLVEVERVAAWLGIAPSELLARADERVA